MDDNELLAAHVAGDPEAFAQLVERHRDRLWSVALRTTGDPEDASDALQDALLSAYRRADQFRGESQVTTWLHRIVVNASLDRIRKRRPTLPLPEFDTDAMAEERDRIEDRMVQLTVLDALADLPEEQRDALITVDLEGYSVEEAAVMLDCAPGTIKSRRARARATLADRLATLRNPNATAGVIPPKGVDE